MNHLRQWRLETAARSVPLGPSEHPRGGRAVLRSARRTRPHSCPRQYRCRRRSARHSRSVRARLRRPALSRRGSIHAGTLPMVYEDDHRGVRHRLDRARVCSAEIGFDEAIARLPSVRALGALAADAARRSRLLRGHRHLHLTTWLSKNASHPPLDRHTPLAAGAAVAPPTTPGQSEGHLSTHPPCP